MRPCDLQLAYQRGDDQRPGLSRPMGRLPPWVIQVEGKWLARCKDQSSNPMPLNEAKAAAMAMAKGAPGDYVVMNPIAHLNGIAARLLDANEAARQRTALVCGKNRYAGPDHPRCSEPRDGCLNNRLR